MQFSLKATLLLLLGLLVGIPALSFCARAQSLGNTGTIMGSVVDPSGAVVPSAKVTLTNPVTGYANQTTTGGDGSFRFNNLPPNAYHLEVKSEKFSLYRQS